MSASWQQNWIFRGVGYWDRWRYYKSRETTHSDHTCYN